MEKKPWTEEEVEFIRNHHATMSSREMAEHLPGRSEQAVHGRRYRLDIEPKLKAWTDDEIQFLLDNYETCSKRELAEKLGRTERSLIAKWASLENKPKKNEIRIGDRFERLCVASDSRIEVVSGRRVRVVDVYCVCNPERNYPIILSLLAKNRVASCGCLRRERAGEAARRNNTSHGMSKTRLYEIWCSMRKRCQNESSQSFADYGARGITVCEEWEKFEAFAEWALANGYQEDLQIDRRDNDAGYSPENCRFVTYTENANNKRNNHFLEAFGERKTLAEWSRDPRCVVNLSALYDRCKYPDWTNEEIISKPKQQ